MYKLFYRPSEPNSAAADFIPYYEKGKFHIFFLFDHRNAEKFKEGVTWYKIETNNFISFIEKGEMLSKGNKNDFDMYCFTGCVIKQKESYHIFYTGHNPYIKTYGNQLEVIMHAISDDLTTWTKIPEDTFLAPNGYDPCDFRDPFVYYDEADNIYYMLLCARKTDDVALRNGETIRMKSKNLQEWSMDKVIYAPHAFQTHECPDLFKIGDYWYLVFSEYSDRNVTCYRMSNSPTGPWRKPKNDTFDGRAYYAAKTAFNGENRYLFGWVPTRTNNKDNENWMWGGNLVVHELYANANGELNVRPPKTIIEAFTKKIYSEETIQLSNVYGCTVTSFYEAAPSTFLLTFNVLPSLNCDKFGLLIKQNLNLDKAYEFRFDLANGQLYANRFPCFPQNEFSNYQLQRKLNQAKIYNITLISDEDVFVLYVNDEIALSLRVCETFGQSLGFYVSDGDIKIENLKLKKL